jgi:hypothetical protein
MLHIEKIFEEAGIESEIEAYAPLVPDGGNWKATMLIEYPDPNERKRELARLIGVEDRLFAVSRCGVYLGDFAPVRTFGVVDDVTGDERDPVGSLGRLRLWQWRRGGRGWCDERCGGNGKCQDLSNHGALPQ